MKYLFIIALLSGPPDNTILVFTDPAICQPCVKYEPVLNEVSKTHRLKKYKPADEPELTKFFNVTLIPTTIVYVNKKEVSRHVGSQSKMRLLSMKGVKYCEK